MEYVTKATEKRISQMIKNGNKYADILLYLLNELKSRIGWFGGTIKEIEKYRYHVDNEQQIRVNESNILRGMGNKFEKYITVVFCEDLHHADIKDFNALVKVCNKYIK